MARRGYGGLVGSNRGPSDGGRGGESRARREARVPAVGRAKAALLASVLGALVATLVTGCGLGPFAGDGGANDSSAIASPGPEVPTPPEASAAESPLLSEQLDPNSAVGALAPGFPADLLPVPAGAEVLVSSVEPVADSNAYQVSLNLRTSLAAPDVVDVFRTSLTAAGFTEVELTAPDAALAAQSTFTRSAGDELLVIGVLDRDGLRTVTIGGRLRGDG